MKINVVFKIMFKPLFAGLNKIQLTYEYPCKCWLVHLAAVTSFRLGMTLISSEIYGDEIKVNSLSHPTCLNMDERQDKEYNQICSSYRLREEPLT